MTDLLGVTLDDMIAEVRRELAMRVRVYAEWKRSAGPRKRDQLDRQYEVMQAVLERLEAERDGNAQQNARGWPGR